MKKKVLAALGAVGVMAIGLFAVAAVGAQEVDDVTRPFDNLISRVAEKLGVSEDEFTDAWKQSQIELIDEAVANGDLNADEADEMKNRIAESDGIFTPRPHGEDGPRDGPRDERAPGHMIINKAANAVLGLEDGELKEAYAEGLSLLDVALANGFTEDEFTGALLDEIQGLLNVMVDAEEISQEQADEIYARISENIGEIITHTKDDGPRDRPRDGFPVHKLIFGAANMVLGLEEGELREAFEEGQSLLDVALANGFTEDEFTTALLDEVQGMLAALVDEGEIGTEQADEVYARISENIDEIINHSKDDGPRGDRPGQDGPPGDRPGHDGPPGDRPGHDGPPGDVPHPHGPPDDVPETDISTTDL